MVIRPVVETIGQQLRHAHDDGRECLTTKPQIIAPCGAFEVLWEPVPASTWLGPAWEWPEGRDIVSETAKE